MSEDLRTTDRTRDVRGIRAGRAAPRRLRRALMASTILMSTLLGSDWSAADDAYLNSAQKYLDEGKPADALIEVKNALQANPNDAQARFLLGKVYLRMGDAENAEAALLRARELGAAGEELDLMLAYARLSKGAFQDVLTQTEQQTAATSGTQRDIISARGDALLGLGKVDEALDAYDRVLAGGPHAMALRGKAVIALMQQHPEESRKLLDQALALEPSNDEIIAADAEWYLRQGKPEQARTRFIASIEVNPLKLMPRIGLVRASLAAGDVKGALKEVEELKKLQPNNLLILFQDSIVQLAAGNYEEAKRTADQILAADRYHSGAMNVAGNSAYALGLYEQAAQRLTNYIQVVPTDNQARLVLAASLLRLKDASTAKTVLQPLMTAEPQDATALALMGTAEAIAGNKDAAIGYLEKALAQSPEDEALRSQLGIARIAVGDAKQGIADLQQVINLTPSSDSGIDARDITLIVGYLKTGDFATAFENIQRLKEIHPDDVRLLVLEGASQMGAGRKDLAAASFSRAIALDPQAADAKLNLAKLESQDGDLEAAKKLLEDVVAAHPDHYFAMLELSSLAARAGDAELQATWLDRAIAAHPELLPLRVQVALFYLSQQRAEKALEIAKAGLDQNPDSIELLGIVGQAQLQTGQAEPAIATFERLVKLPPESVETHFLLARAYGLAGRHEQMRSELTRALELDPDHLPSQVALLRFLVLVGQLPEAEKRMQAMKAAHPDDPDVLAQEGWMRLQEGKPEAAVTPLETAYNRAGASVSREIVDSLARAKWETKQWDASLAIQEGWLAKNPNDVPMLLSVAQAYTQLRRHEDALKAYQRVQGVMPNNVVALNNLAWLLQKTSPDEALGYAEKADAAAPGTPSIQDTYAWLLLQKGEAERAADLLEQAVQKAPTNPQYRYHLAQALYAAGNRDRARQLLEELLADQRLEPEHPKIRAMLEKMVN